MKFTVIIPTRERSDTLYCALKTCVTQDYDNLEILVSDNFSQDNTREVVDSFKERRIRYINTGKRVSMSSNWEFALSHVEDGYVFYLGDDDGLMPSALNDACKIIKHFKCPAVVWPKVGYAWPCQSYNASRMIIPLRKELILCDSNAILSAIVRGRLTYDRGPCIYNSFVDSKVISKVKGANGRFFNSLIPDIYSSFALLSGMASFVYCERPLSVGGGSRHSNGFQAKNFANLKLDQAWGGDQFLLEADLPVHRSMDLLPGSLTASVTEALMQANDACYGGKIKISLRKVIWKVLDEYSSRDQNTYRIGLEHLERFSERMGMKAYFRVFKTLHPNRYVETNLYRADKTYLGYLHLQSVDKTFGVQDVFGAADVAQKILGDFVMPSNVRYFRSYHPYTGFLHRRLATYMDVR